MVASSDRRLTIVGSLIENDRSLLVVLASEINASIRCRRDVIREQRAEQFRVTSISVRANFGIAAALKVQPVLLAGTLTIEQSVSAKTGRCRLQARMSCSQIATTTKSWPGRSREVARLRAFPLPVGSYSASPSASSTAAATLAGTRARDGTGRAFRDRTCQIRQRR